VIIPDRARRWFRKPLESVLYEGEIRLQTGPGFAGHQLRVRTAEGYIEVAGTAVSVYKGKDFTCVCVLEGTARMGQDEARMEDVAAGLRKVMFRGDRPSVVSAIEPHHKEELLKFLNRHKGVFD
jgi:ferric-dicitrate binding protein FerR (iron transport regulator)